MNPAAPAAAPAAAPGLELHIPQARAAAGADCLLTGPLEPTNLCGPGDSFSLESSHVLPALIRKFHEAKAAGRGEVVVLMQRYSDEAPINVGCGSDVSIAELARLVGEVVGFSGKLVFDTTKPDGTPRKLLDVSKLSALGWAPKIGLMEGIASTYWWYVEHGAESRQ